MATKGVQGHPGIPESLFRKRKSLVIAIYLRDKVSCSTDFLVGRGSICLPMAFLCRCSRDSMPRDLSSRSVMAQSYPLRALPSLSYPPLHGYGLVLETQVSPRPGPSTHRLCCFHCLISIMCCFPAHGFTANTHALGFLPYVSSPLLGFRDDHKALSNSSR